MLVNISPLRCNFHPTLCALRFAQDVKRMRNSVSPIKGRWLLNKVDYIFNLYIF